MTIIKLIDLIEGNGKIFNIFHLRLSFIQVLDDLKWEKLILKKTRHTMQNDQLGLMVSLIKENVITLSISLDVNTLFWNSMC